MRIAVGCDHRGYAAKRELLPLLENLGHGVQDFGCDGCDGVSGVDYPDIAYPLAVAVASERCDLGVLIDGNGMGMTIAANKVHGVRAAVAQDEFSAQCAREQHHCNIIVVGADLIGGKDIHRIVEVFLRATIAGGRHAQRIKRIQQIEEMLAQAQSRQQGHPTLGASIAIRKHEPNQVFS